MLNKYLKIITISVLNLSFIIYHLSLTRSVYAQSVSLGIWPPILQVMIQPGKGITQVYKLNNLGDPVIVTSSVVPFVASGEKGGISLIDCSKVEVIGCESLGWFSFQNANLNLGQSFFLGSGRTQEVVLKIGVPDYASEGDYYNTLLFTTQAPPAEAELKSRSTATIGSNILITVSKSGNPTRTINISEFTTKKFFGLPVFDSFDTIPITLKVQNTGTAYTGVSGKITLNGFPGLKSDHTIPSQNILAGNTRLLTATPSAKLSSSQSSLSLPKGFYFGRYTLEAKVENDAEQSRQAKISFYALPIKFVFYVLLTSILFIVSLKLLAKIKRSKA